MAIDMGHDVLVTGSNGFIGRNFVRACADAGWSPHGIDVCGDSEAVVSFRRGAVSVANMEAFGVGFDAVVHFAGAGGVGAAEADPDLARENTVRSTAEVLEYARLHAGCRVVYVSSAAVYGNAGGVYSEHSPLQPISLYGKLKLEAEECCRKYNETHHVPVHIIRPFSIYGVGLRKQLLWDFCRRADKARRDGAPTIACFGTGREKRDFVNVRDVVAQILGLLDSHEQWSIVNSGTGIATSVDDVQRMICENLGYDGDLVYDCIARPGNPESLVASAGAFAANDMVSVRDGIREYVEWFKTA